MEVSVLANGLLAAETVERMVCVANSVRRVSGSLSETVNRSSSLGVGLNGLLAVALCVRRN